MPCPSPAAPRCSESPSCSETEPAESPEGCSRLYGPRFWHAYAANTLVTVACAILFRYADFVTVLGGTELQLGWIVGVGMVGSVLARFSLGTAIDQHGPKLIWLGSLAVLAACCLAHLTVSKCDGLGVYLLRLLFCTSIAGIFGASTTFVSYRVTMARMAELLGILGTSGFVGMMLGTQLGDMLAGSGPMERWIVDRMFIAAGISALAAIPFAWLATRKTQGPPRHIQPVTLAAIRKYQPGFVLIVAVVTGAALSLPQTFLRTYAEGIHVPRIGIFFTVVAATAVTTRLVNRHVLDRLGLSVMIFIGLGLLALAQVLYLVVHSEWQFVFPGLPYGIGQAILYPVIAAVGTATFPIRYRGMGITLVLAAFDVGQLIAGPLAGGVLHACAAAGLAGYPTLFLATGSMLVTVGAVYWWTLKRQASADAPPEHAVILRFPSDPGERRRAPVGQAASLPVGPANERKLAACSTTRPRSDNSRSTAAVRR